MSTIFPIKNCLDTAVVLPGFDIPVLVLLLNHHNNVGQGSTSQLTNEVVLTFS